VTSTAPSTKRAYRFLDFCKTYQVGKDRAYADIRSGALIARKVGKNTIILLDDAEAYIASLPRLELPPIPEAEDKAPPRAAAGSTLASELGKARAQQRPRDIRGAGATGPAAPDAGPAVRRGRGVAQA